jgi:hypothetical protein
MKTVSPTKVGKAQNKSKGIDVGTKVLEGSGSSIYNKLPPKVKKQLKSQINQLENKLDKLIEQKKEMLKEMLNDGVATAEQLARDAITEFIPEEALNDIESVVTGDKTIEDLYNEGRKPPKIPSVSLSDNLRTEDPMGDIVSNLEDTIQKAISDSLTGVVSSLLKELKKIVDDLRKGKAPDFGKLLNKADQLKDAFKDAFKEVFKDVMDFPNMLEDQIEELIENFLDDVIGSLTGSEMADLLEGNPSDDVKQHIDSVLNHKHQELKEAIKDTTDVENVFSKAGELLGDEILDEARTQEVGENIVSTSGLLCDDDLVEGDLGGNAYGDRLSGQRAKEQDKAEKDKLKELAKDLAELIDGSGEGIDGQLDSVPTDPSCADALKPENVPALNQANNMVIDSLLSSVKSSFNRDLMGAKTSFVINKNEEPTGEKLKQLQESDVMLTMPGSNVVMYVAPGLRDSLRSNSTFSVRNKPGESWAIDFLSSAIRVSKNDSFEDPVILNLKNKISSQKKEIQAIDEDLADLKEEFGNNPNFTIPPDMTARKSKLESEVATGTAQLEALTEASVEVAKANESFVASNVKSVVYNIVPAKKEVQKFEDSYQVELVNTPFLANETETFSSFISEKTIENKLGLSPSQELDQESILQAQAFAAFAKAKVEGAGILTTADKQIEKKFLDSTASGIYAKIFTDLIKKTAKQVSASPLFDIQEFESLKLLPNFNPTSLCAPEDLDNQDLLGLATVVNDIKESYSNQCEPLDKKEGESSVFEKEVSAGVVKVTTRVFMLESLIKSMFCFTEWSPNSLLKERLFLDFIMHKMKTGLKSFNPMFYRDLCATAKEMVDDEVKKDKEIKNTYDIINLDILLNEENPENEYGEEALKYIAMQQLPDILNKLQDKFSSPTRTLFERFTNPPPKSRRQGSTETTPPGISLSPTRDGGWIRTIDVPTNYVYGGDVTSFTGGAANFAVSQTGNRFLKTNKSNTGNLTETLNLNYPDLAKECGTFFIEKYIRVEDKTQAPQNINQNLVDRIRGRNGGPNGPSAQESINLDHTSGVVNMSSWVSFMKELKAEFTSSEQLSQTWSAAKSSDFFKPLRYGLRLIWVPPMNPNGATQLLVKQQSVAAPDAAEQLNSSQDSINFDDRQDKLFEKQDDFSMFERAMFEAVINTGQVNANNTEIFKREKAFVTQEEIFFISATTTGNNAIQFSKVARPIFTLPLISVESDIEGDFMLSDYANDGFFDFNSDTDINPNSPLSKLRSEMINSEEYKLLFDYIFPINRMTSLVTIYNSNALSLMNPQINNIFNSSKEVCRSLYYTLSPDDSKKWWSKQDETVSELGGNAGLLQKDMMNQSVKGPSVDLFSMAAMTVPIMIRGMADFYDPHYKFVSYLQDLGVPYIKKDYSSLLPLWPSNLLGWAPPLTMWGAMAYAMPMLEGDKRKNEKDKTNAEAKQNPLESCEDEE